MIHRPLHFIFSAAILLLASACGTSSGSSNPGTSNQLTVQSISVGNGNTWEVNRSIEITFDRPIDFASVNSSSIHIRDSNGLQAGGMYSQPLDATASVQTHKLVFQPTCPLQVDGSDAGFTPGGTAYRLSILGTDQGGSAIRPLDGIYLAETTTVDFFTPASTAPSIMFYDSLAGPPQVKVRETGGVSSDDPYATHVEVAATPSGLAYFHYNSLAGLGILTASDIALLGDGLPRNHYSIQENQVGFVFVFDQAVNPDPVNLNRIQVQYLNGTWKSLIGKTELISNCAGNGNGSLVRFSPFGLLPPGSSLRLQVKAGFQDLTGQPTIVQAFPLATANTTFSTTGSSVGVDEFVETFSLSGDAPGSIEDTEVTFNVPKAVWGGNQLSPVWGTHGQSRARSKWIPLGLGRLNPGGPNLNPSFIFSGTQRDGTIPIVGGIVDPDPMLSAPIPLVSLETQAITIPLSELVSLDEVYMAQPSLLQGYAVALNLPGESGAPFALRILRAIPSGNNVRITLANSCEFGLGDCVPLDLNLSFPNPNGVTATLRPRSLSMATRFIADLIPPDARITILFDATVADASGNPDPTAAVSGTLGWFGDIEDLSGGPWDFVRFEIFFEMDVSGDGWGPFDPLPHMRWLSFGFDQRP
jgi:hypothetical protein